MHKGIANVSVSGALDEKLAAIAAAKFDVIEVFDNDLVASPLKPLEVAQRCADLGLSIDLFQRRGRRQDRRWSTAWSPEQIANRLPIEFPDDESMRISHEAIYQALYVQNRGALRRDLTACLRTGRALRVPRSRARGRGTNFISDEVMISERPSEAADRAVPGH